MKIKKSTYLPAILLIYLIFMAYLGLPILKRGDYLYYFSVAGISLLAIIMLHFTLKRKERRSESRKDASTEKNQE